MTEQPIQPPRNPRDIPCLICGKSEFTWGELRVGMQPPGEFVYFRPEGTTWEAGDIPTYVRHCEICGNIAVFTVDS